MECLLNLLRATAFSRAGTSAIEMAIGGFVVALVFLMLLPGLNNVAAKAVKVLWHAF